MRSTSRCRPSSALATRSGSGTYLNFSATNSSVQFVIMSRWCNRHSRPKTPFWRRGGSLRPSGSLAVSLSPPVEIGKILGVDSFLEVTVEDDAKLDFSGFDIRRHAGVQLDGVGDACILWRNREVLQGRPKECKGGRSATMVYSYPYTLASRAVIVTMDLSARNLDMFRTNHWLSDPANCEVLRLTGPAYVAPSASVARAAVAPRDAMAAWSVRELHDFLQDQDLAGPAAHLQSQGCSGGDFLSLTPRDFERDLKLTRFAARKLVAARDRFLAQPAQ